VVNGGMIGLMCWALQLAFFHGLGRNGALAYWVSALAASAIGIAVNYRIQRRFIFARHGNFWAFAAAATLMSVSVSFAAVAAREWLATFAAEATATRLGYVVGALGLAPVSFALKKLVIFRGSPT
jgi:putative flippase GtrA